MKKEILNTTIEKIRNGNEEAFAVVYDNFSPALYGICLKILQDEEKAQDILQVAFVKIWKNIHQFNPAKGTFFTWMLNITRNSAIDEYRKLKKHQVYAIQDKDMNVGFKRDQSNITNTDTIGVLNLTQNLPQEQQIIIDYLYYRGFTQQEVADELNMPLGTVKTRARTAIKALRKMFVLIFTL